MLGYLYGSTGYQDELAYAAAMLFKATGEHSARPGAQQPKGHLLLLAAAAGPF